MGRWPVTLYRSQWERLLNASAEISAFTRRTAIASRSRNSLDTSSGCGRNVTAFFLLNFVPSLSRPPDALARARYPTKADPAIAASALASPLATHSVGDRASYSLMLPSYPSGLLNA